MRLYELTKFEDIYKLFLGSIQDYSLSDLFVKNSDVAEDMMETFLIRGLPGFINCQKDISDLDMVNKSFRVGLTLEEQRIVADLMLLAWLDRRVTNVLQMDLKLQDNDFKTFSEEKNLREKSMYADRIREKVSQEMVDYGLHTTSFSDWAVGNYGI